MYPIPDFMFGQRGIARRQNPNFVAITFELNSLIVDNALRTALGIAEVSKPNQEHTHRILQLALRTLARNERNFPP